MSDKMYKAMFLVNEGLAITAANGKRPFIRNWNTDNVIKTTDGVSIVWSNNPGANPAILTGAINNFFVIDIDGEEGENTLNQLERTYGLLPETRTVKTPNGRHLYFRIPEGVRIGNDSKGKLLGNKVDIKGDGGCVLAAGSSNDEGAIYKCLDEKLPIANPPGWLIKLLTQQPCDSKNRSSLPIKNPINNSYGRAALSKAVEKVANIGEGQRNDTLNDEAYCLGQLISAGALEEPEVMVSLLQAAVISGLSEGEAKQTIQSGIQAGKKQPRDLSYLRASSNSSKVKTGIKSISARELASMDLQPIQYIVPDLLPEGLTILAGRPKIGKSFLSLGLCLSVSTGEKSFGSITTPKATVFYMALEDPRRRLFERLMQFIGEDEHRLNDSFQLTGLECELGQQALSLLEDWLDAHTDCKLVVIDTMARFFPGDKRNNDRYNLDTAMLSELQKIAINRKVAIVLIHHTRKSESEQGDPLDEVLGSTGLTGVADSIWVLKRPRGKDDGVLHITGRDVEEQQLAMHFDSTHCSWKILGDVTFFSQSESRQKIHEAFASSREPLGPKQIAEMTGLRYANVRHLVLRMERDGVLTKILRGQYQLTSVTTSQESVNKDSA